MFHCLCFLRCCKCSISRHSPRESRDFVVSESSLTSVNIHRKGRSTGRGLVPRRAEDLFCIGKIVPFGRDEYRAERDGDAHIVRAGNRIQDRDQLQLCTRVFAGGSAVMNDAVERGLYTKKKSASNPTSNADGTNTIRKDFMVDDIPKGIKKKQRSIELYDDIATRLNKLRDDKCQYTFASILNQLLDEALKKYGY